VVKETVGAGYFAVLNEPILAGREFDQSDQRVDAEATIASGAAVPTLPLVLNEKAAYALFGKNSPIGKHLRGDRRAYEVVGLVPNMKDARGKTQAIAYPPLTWHDFSSPPGGGITIVARRHSAEDALGGVRSVVASMDPNLTLFNQQTLSEHLELIRSAMRSALRMFGGIGVFGLVLSAIGLAGVTGCAVAQRRKEICGRSKHQALPPYESGMALFAAGQQVRWLAFLQLSFTAAKLSEKLCRTGIEGTRHSNHHPIPHRRRQHTGVDLSMMLAESANADEASTGRNSCLSGRRFGGRP
jgi:hypothetical protein